MSRITTMIDGIEYSYDTNLAYEKDGHVYCKICNGQKDGKVLEMPFTNTKHIYTKDCECDIKRREKEEARKRAMEIDGLKRECFRYDRSLIKSTFTNMQDINSKQVDFAKKYVNRFDEMKKENIGIILSGPVGSGKTYIAAAIANEVIEKYLYRVKVRNIPQIIRDIEKGGFDLDKNKYLQNECSAQLLIFDDFGIERNTEYVMELLYSIIDTRYRMNLPTIITTNIIAEEFYDETKPMAFQRIYSRILEMCGVMLKVTGKDRRKNIAREKSNMALDIIGR